MPELMQIYEPGQTPLPHADVTAIGIDLGTTHSVVAVSTNAEAEAIADAHGRSLIPSIVQLQRGHALVGHQARTALTEGEEGVITSIKRVMGKSAEEAARLDLPYATDGSTGTLRLLVGHERITPEEISAEILRHLKRVAEEALGREVNQAVITVPAYFDESARQATKNAAKLAGLTVLRLISEPTAAALAYGLDTQVKGTYAIYDLGGGTFDISILKLEEGVFQVLSTAGDTALGGDDIDAAVARHVLAANKEAKIPAPEFGMLLMAARTAKERLSQQETADVEWEGTRTPITRAQLEAMAAPFIRRTLECCDAALRDAALTPDQIDGVVLVGGSTRLLLVKEQVKAFFGRDPYDKLDPDLVVALGAALQAEALTKGSDNLLLDVVPLSLGLETMGGITEKIIYRNTPIPAASAQEFTTWQDGQTAMSIHVVQGEREKVIDNRSLAKFTLKNIPPMAAGMARIRVTFALDADGLLTVSAKELATGTEQVVEVAPSSGLAFEEMERMLTDSMQHAMSDITERLLIEARVEAERTRADVVKAMAADSALLKAGEREMIDAQLARLEKAMAGTDRERIDYEVKGLNELIGPFAQRRMDAAISDALSGKKVDEVK